MVRARKCGIKWGEFAFLPYSTRRNHSTTQSFTSVVSYLGDPSQYLPSCYLVFLLTKSTRTVQLPSKRAPTAHSCLHKFIFGYWLSTVFLLHPRLVRAPSPSGFVNANANGAGIHSEVNAGSYEDYIPSIWGLF
ncbi:hypothetical protein BDZ89DRAFT_506852 [Hymenopellis radicata]|nr:hypothetical protein BDZ89DRAFT_506852 [Hymenopellis radicata]